MSWQLFKLMYGRVPGRYSHASWQLSKLVYSNIPGVAKIIFKNPLGVLREIKEAGKLARDLTPAAQQLPYHIPEYQEGMTCNKSREKYLRPTYFCESNAPEIIAMANNLGAFQKSDREYVEACFEFVKRNIGFSAFQAPGGAVKTLHSGKGMCMNSASLFIALCRAGGIPARYRIYDAAQVMPTYELITSDNQLLKDWHDSMYNVMLAVSSEALVNGEWLIAEFIWPWSLEAGLGLPLSHLGDDASGTSCYRVRGSTMRLESIPPRVTILIALAMKLFGNLFSGVEIRLQQKMREGKKILGQLGEEEYSRRAQKNYRAILPEISRKLQQALEQVGEE